MKTPVIRSVGVSKAGIAAIVIAVGFASCSSGPSEGEVAARNEVERLQNELQTRDSLIGEMTLSFDEIEQNIALMDDREKVLGENAEGELNMDKRGRMVNRAWGEPSSQLLERHDASDFELRTQDKIAPAA